MNKIMTIEEEVSYLTLLPSLTEESSPLTLRRDGGKSEVILSEREWDIHTLINRIANSELPHHHYHLIGRLWGALTSLNTERYTNINHNYYWEMMRSGEWNVREIITTLL